MFRQIVLNLDFKHKLKFVFGFAPADVDLDKASLSYIVVITAVIGSRAKEASSQTWPGKGASEDQWNCHLIRKQ